MEFSFMEHYIQDSYTMIQQSIFKLPLRGELRELICILLISILAACSHPSDKTVETKLSQAESIMYAAPDSALQLLENLQPPKGKEQRATWALLLAQARYKTEVQQSDSLVNTAYNYFKKTDDAERKALALYLKGSLEDEAKHIDEAQTFYPKIRNL